MVKKASLKIALSSLKLTLLEDMEEYDSSELKRSFFVSIDLIYRYISLFFFGFGQYEEVLGKGASKTV